LTVCRYVERNAARARLVERPEGWRWSSLWHRRQRGPGTNWLDDGPVVLPAGCVEYVNQPETEAELSALRRSLVRGARYGGERWRKETAQRLGLQSTLRRRGQQRRTDTGSRDDRPALFSEERE
jgi:putative transposase